MKAKTILLSLFALISLITFDSCKKYPDGPTLSLRTKTGRVSNVWKVEKCTKNGADITASKNDRTYEFRKDGVFIYTSGSKTEQGSWAFINKKEWLDVKTSDPYKWEILRLKEKEMWVRENDGDVFEYHLVPR
ncbi:MAG: hypothetical protein Q8L81_18160 [Bacteroidota bacterium]|nr:hypothetical protein [Bacteroidota bacterium]